MWWGPLSFWKRGGGIPGQAAGRAPGSGCISCLPFLQDGLQEKNPVRNFLDDPRRSGPFAESDRREGSRRHVRNWGGPDFDKVKTGMEQGKEWPPLVGAVWDVQSGVPAPLRVSTAVFALPVPARIW